MLSFTPAKHIYVGSRAFLSQVQKLLSSVENHVRRWIVQQFADGDLLLRIVHIDNSVASLLVASAEAKIIGVADVKRC